MEQQRGRISLGYCTWGLSRRKTLKSYFSRIILLLYLIYSIYSTITPVRGLQILAILGYCYTIEFYLVSSFFQLVSMMDGVQIGDAYSSADLRLPRREPTRAVQLSSGATVTSTRSCKVPSPNSSTSLTHGISLTWKLPCENILN